MHPAAREVVTPHPGLLQPGHNCWRIEHSAATSVIIDTADYFAAFAAACRQARHQILILGWDFDRHESLFHDGQSRDLPDQIGAFLGALVRRNAALHVHFLSWNFNMIYAAERELLPALRIRLQNPPRFQFRLDGSHPPGASQHQKIVVIDNKVAFCGGIDLSRWRWDTHEHAPGDPRRIDPNGKPYPPFHDMMMLVEGDAAKALGELARQRWSDSQQADLPQPPDYDGSPWPETVPRELIDHNIAISRTLPAYEQRSAVREIEALYCDAIASADSLIYIENQYFTSQALATAIQKRLRENDGPEVVLVLPQQTGGWLEQMTMDVLRARVVRQLKQADCHNHLRIYFPHQPGLGDDCISVHAKLLIVDDSVLRIGSSNTSNRSMGFDSECDLTLLAESRTDPAAALIRGKRHALLAEHLGLTVAHYQQQETELGSMIAAIEALQSDGRSLHPLDCPIDPELDELLPDNQLVDPPEPYSSDYFKNRYLPEEGRKSGRQRLWIFAGLVVLLLSLAALWQLTPLNDYLQPDRLGATLASLPSEPLRAAVTIGGVWILSLFMLPLTLLAMAASIIFGTWQSFIYVLLGALLSAASGFVIGRLVSKDAVEKYGNRLMKTLSRKIANRGVVSVAVLRLVPVAPFTVFNLVSGASQLQFRHYMIGSLLGLAPGLAGVTLFSGSLWQALTAPTGGNIAFALLAAILVLGFALATRKWLK